MLHPATRRCSQNTNLTSWLKIPTMAPSYSWFLSVQILGPPLNSFWNSGLETTSPDLYFSMGSFSSVQSLSRVQLFATPWTAARQASLSITDSGLYPNSCPLSVWCHPNISSSVIPFSSCLQSFPASGSFQISQLFAWGGQSIGISASTSVLPMKSQDWSLLGWIGCISLQSKGLSRVFSNTTVQKHQFFGAQLSLWSNSDIHTWLLKNTIALTRWTLAGKVMSLLFNMLFRLVITFLPKSKHFLNSWLQSPSAVILELPKIKSATLSTVSPTISNKVMGMDAMILVFWMLSFKATF